MISARRAGPPRRQLDILFLFSITKTALIERMLNEEVLHFFLSVSVFILQDMRRHVMMTLLDTEQSYVESLRSLIQVTN